MVGKQVKTHILFVSSDDVASSDEDQTTKKKRRKKLKNTNAISVVVQTLRMYLTKLQNIMQFITKKNSKNNPTVCKKQIDYIEREKCC